MRKRETKIRRFIREAALYEGDLTSSSSSQKDSALEKQNRYIGPYVTIDPAATVVESEVGIPYGEDKSSIAGASTVARSAIHNNSQVINSDLLGVHVTTNTKIVGSTLSDGGIRDRASITVSGCSVKDSRIIATQEYSNTYYNSRFENMTAENCDVTHSFVMGNSSIKNCTVSDSELRGVKVRNNLGESSKIMIRNVKSLGATIECVDRKNAMIIEGVINWVHLVDSAVGSGVSIDCVPNGEGYIEKAVIWGGAKITGEPQIIGLRDERTGREQSAEIWDDSKISGSPKISGRVSGNAHVFGNAEVHGLAHITGDCKVSGTARMISGTYTTGVYTEGTHEGGDPPSLLDKMASKVAGAVGI